MESKQFESEVKDTSTWIKEKLIIKVDQNQTNRLSDLFDNNMQAFFSNRSPFGEIHNFTVRQK